MDERRLEGRRQGRACAAGRARQRCSTSTAVACTAVHQLAAVKLHVSTTPTTQAARRKPAGLQPGMRTHAGRGGGYAPRRVAAPRRAKGFASAVCDPLAHTRPPVRRGRAASATQRVPWPVSTASSESKLSSACSASTDADADAARCGRATAAATPRRAAPGRRCAARAVGARDGAVAPPAPLIL